MKIFIEAHKEEIGFALGQKVRITNRDRAKFQKEGIREKGITKKKL